MTISPEGLGRIMIVTARDGMRWTRQRFGATGSQGGFSGIR